MNNAVPEVDALVIGGGLGGLSAAYSLVKAGLAPLVVEERGKPGGLVAGIHCDGVAFDIGAESFVSSATRVHDLLAELGLEVIEPTGSSWVYGHDTGAIPIPHGMLGIPASLDDPVVTSALSSTDLARARADLTMGPEPGSDCEDLASFVRQRFGQGLLDTFVTPVAGGIHSADPQQLSVDKVCRGLRKALATCGSATKAVAQLRGTTPAKSAIVAPRGGMFRLPEVLATRIEAGGGRIATHYRALKVTRNSTGSWLVTLTKTRSNPNPALPPLACGCELTVSTSRLIIALPLFAGLELLDTIDGLDVSRWQPTPGGPIAHVTLVIAHHGLDKGPRGSGMLVRRPTVDQIAAGGVRAKALTHYSHKWDWMRQEHPDIHVLRVSYGRAGEEPFPITVEQARRDAEQLLGIELPPACLKHSFIIHWDGALPPLGPTHWEHVAALTNQIATDYPGLALTGAWVGGSGIGAVIPHGLDTGTTLAKTGPASVGAPTALATEVSS